MAGDWGLLPWTPIYLGVAAMAVAAWRVLPGIMERANERARDKAAEREADWKRLRDEVERYADELRDVRENEKECQHQLAEVERRLAQVEGYMMGQGKALNEAQRIVSGERLSDKAAKDKNGDG